MVESIFTLGATLFGVVQFFGGWRIDTASQGGIGVHDVERIFFQFLVCDLGAVVNAPEIFGVLGTRCGVEGVQAHVH